MRSAIIDRGSRMGTQYRVTLTKEEVEELQAFCNKGTHPSRAVLCARALLLLDRGENNSRPWKLEEVANSEPPEEAFCHRRTRKSAEPKAAGTPVKAGQV